MCGIVGFTGNRQAAPILLDGLSKLEYRGYDSAGLAVRDGEALAQVVKAKGRLSNLIEKTDPLGRRNLRRVQPALRHLIDFITVQHQVGCESIISLLSGAGRAWESRTCSM